MLTCKECGQPGIHLVCKVGNTVYARYLLPWVEDSIKMPAIDIDGEFIANCSSITGGRTGRLKLPAQPKGHVRQVQLQGCHGRKPVARAMRRL